MKSMTCSELGGACELRLEGTDANEIIKAQDRHLREAVAAGSTEHEPALRDMKSRWRRPLAWTQQAPGQLLLMRRQAR